MTAGVVRWGRGTDPQQTDAIVFCLKSFMYLFMIHLFQLVSHSFFLVRSDTGNVIGIYIYIYTHYMIMYVTLYVFA